MKRNLNKVHGKKFYRCTCILLLLYYYYSGVCSNEEDDPVRDKLDVFFNPLSKAYMEICKKQKREFFGLRDFYRCCY